MQSVNEASARVTARLKAGLAPRGIKWWKNGVYAYWCDFCDKTFSKSDHLVTHMRTHTGERAFKCAQCDSSFAQKGNLVIHMRTHTGERPFKCAQCNKSFARSSSLVIHMRTHTGERPFKCSECDSSFTGHGDLVKHMRTHTGERPFKCPECDNSFAQYGNLMAHMLTHTGERPFKCAQCNNSFAQSGNLVKHMRTHTGERPFKCSECDSSFARSSSLVFHMRTHTGERPFKCAQCDYTCSESGSLVVHMRTHTGERPFKCTECDHASTTSSNLAIHLEGVHDVGKHKCDYCLGNRNTRNKHFDAAAKANVHICRACYKKATGFTSRIEKRWCEYTDEHLGTVGLMGTDNSLRSLGGCSMNRPDRLYGDQDRIELDECDENQHRGSSYTCEQKRISDFYNEPSICGKTMVVIRWNPDGYKPEAGQAKVGLKERLRLFVMLKKALRAQKHLPKIVVFYMFYSRTNTAITVDLPHHHVDSEADILALVKC